MAKRKLYLDIESNGFLNDDTVDYTSSPWKLKENFVIHCVCLTDMDTEEGFDFVQEEVYTKLKDFILAEADEIVAHNQIGYDLMVLMSALDMPFTIGPDTICGVPITITDTLVMSKTLNPDRLGHSIEYFGKVLGLEKIDWRQRAVEIGLIEANSPNGAEFAVYHPEMLVYCRRDNDVGIKVYNYLVKEWGDWNWSDAYELEKAVAEIITKQSHRGFWFNEAHALECVRDLDDKMEKLRNLVEPILPAKPIGKTAAKEYIPCKVQFKKNREPSANILKWVEKHGSKLEQDGDVWFTVLYGKKYTLPMPLEPIITHVPATIKDTTHIKGWLVELGWEPSQYKERDLTVDIRKKKLTPEKFTETVVRYVEQTLSSPFAKHRLEYLDTTRAKLMNRLLGHDPKRPLKVYTNPTLTVGMEKEICPNLLAMADKFPHAKDVSEFLTYSHRRNSFLGGGFDPDDWSEDEEPEKGYLASMRKSDSRIPTPADTCGAGTSRFKHRVVANIPRVTSLYGVEMRSAFGVDKKTHIQLGYDFAGLEARIEGHYTSKYDVEGWPYVNSLLGEKPNDIHTLTAKKISEVLGEPFGRTPAKSVKYAASYGAQPKRIANTIGCSEEMGKRVHAAFWEAAKPLADLNEKLTNYWETTGGKKFILGIDGRKIPTRSKSALINSLFQSAGVICAKRAMVIHDRLLQKAGLSVNFWKDDWKNKEYVQQLIAYHDEGQLEMSKSLVKWKLFDKEEDAKAYKAANPTWSEVGHSSKGYYVCWALAGELAVQAVKESGEYYKLKVPLQADYIMGVNWAQCH